MDDKLVRMCAVNNATKIMELTGKLTVGDMKSIANEIVQYINTGEGEVLGTKIPDMTEAQKRVVDKIIDKYTDICPDGKAVSEALVIATIMNEFGKLPENESSIDKVLAKIPVGRVLIDKGEEFGGI